mgnify:CR=1 FL=1
MSTDLGRHRHTVNGAFQMNHTIAYLYQEYFHIFIRIKE